MNGIRRFFPSFCDVFSSAKISPVHSFPLSLYTCRPNSMTIYSAKKKIKIKVVVVRS